MDQTLFEHFAAIYLIAGVSWVTAKALLNSPNVPEKYRETLEKNPKAPPALIVVAWVIFAPLIALSVALLWPVDLLGSLFGGDE